MIKALNDDARIAVIVVLMKHKQMSFTQLKEHLGLSASSLSSHLTILQNSGLVNNFLQRKENSYSYYVTTDLAKSALSLLYDLVDKLPEDTKTTKMTASADALYKTLGKTVWNIQPGSHSKKRTRAMQAVEETADLTIVYHLLQTIIPRQTSTDVDKQTITVSTGTT